MAPSPKPYPIPPYHSTEGKDIFDLICNERGFHARLSPFNPAAGGIPCPAALGRKDMAPGAAGLIAEINKIPRDLPQPDPSQEVSSLDPESFFCVG